MNGKYQTMDTVYDCAVTSQKIYFELTEGK